jgi:nucleoside-diphosphate-sugar epimerase
MTTSLVTGGCGFVGRHLVRRLLGLGHNLWVVDDLSTGMHPDEWLGGRGQRQPGDVRLIHYSVEGQTVTFVHEDLAVTMLKQLGTIPDARIAFPRFEYVFALASVVGGRLKIDGDPMHVAVDLGIDSLFFLWLVRNRETVGKVLYASSSAAYPINLQRKDGHVALREEMIDFVSGELGQPDMTYGWSKLTGEYLSHLAAMQYGIHIACVRPFSGYGEDQDLTYPVPAIAFRAARGDNPITVWGTGEQGRDFVHIEDCITAMLLAIERIHDGSGINIGTGKLTTFLEVARLFAKLAGYSATVQPAIGKPVGVQSRYCDPANMEKTLGWKPEISREEGFRRVLEAARERVKVLGREAIA